MADRRRASRRRGAELELATEQEVLCAIAALPRAHDVDVARRVTNLDTSPSTAYSERPVAVMAPPPSTRAPPTATGTALCGVAMSASRLCTRTEAVPASDAIFAPSAISKTQGTSRRSSPPTRATGAIELCGATTTRRIAPNARAPHHPTDCRPAPSRMYRRSSPAPRRVACARSSRSPSPLLTKSEKRVGRPSICRSPSKPAILSAGTSGEDTALSGRVANPWRCVERCLHAEVGPRGTCACQLRPARVREEGTRDVLLDAKRKPVLPPRIPALKLLERIAHGVEARLELPDAVDELAAQEEHLTPLQ